MYRRHPAPIVWTAIVAIVGTYLLHFSTFGRKIYGTGGNVKAARYSGINTKRVKLTVLVISGSLAGLVGLTFWAVACRATRCRLGDGA